MKLPEANVYWKDVLPEATVRMMGSAYVVSREGRSDAVAYWLGAEAAAACQFLERRVSRGKSK